MTTQPTIDQLLKQITMLEEENKFLREISENGHEYLKFKQSENKYRLVFETSPDSININRLSDGLYIQTNNGFTNILGYSQDDIKDKSSIDLNIWVNNEDRAYLVKCLKENGFVQNVEAQFRRKDGEIIIGLMSATIIDFNNEQCILSITRDISDRKKIELDLYAKNIEYQTLNNEYLVQNEELIQSNKIIRDILDELRESEERNRTIIESLPDIIFVLNKDGYFLEAYFPDKYDTEAQVNIGNDILQFVSKDDSSEFKSIVEKLYNSGKTQIYRYDSTMNELKRNYEARLLRYQNDKIMVLIREITDELLIKSELEISEQRFRNLVEKSLDGIIVHSEGIIVFANPMALKLFGTIEEREVLGKSINSFLLPEAIHEITNNSEKEFPQMADSSFIELKLKKLNGEEIDIEVGSSKIDFQGFPGIQVIFRDITQRKRIKKALIESEKKYRLLTENAKDLIFRFDIIKRKFEYISPSAEEILGYTVEQLLTGEIKAQDYIHPEWRSFFINQWRRMLRSDVPKYYEYQIIHKSGESRWLNQRNTLIKTEDGKPMAIEAMITDITHRKQSEMELIKAKNKAEEADKLKSAFLANMSHEIRTPMSSILGFSELLKNKELSEDKRDRFVEIINNRGNHLLQIINDIIDISKIEAKLMKICPKEFSLTKLLEEIYDEVKVENSLNKGTQISIYLTEAFTNNEVFISADETKLKQILFNLIHNAMKYTQRGSIEFGYTVLNNNELRFFVKDTGIGIPKEKHELIFERFRQSDDSSSREYGGTGLGLSISKGLSELLGGKIWVESELGIGSTFYFTIAYHSIKQIGDKVEEKFIPIYTHNWNKYSILIVEDDNLSFHFLQEILENTEVKIARARNGQEALTLVKSHNFDIILMDLQLPVMNGNEAIIEIRKFSKVPIIVQSANVLSDDKIKSSKAGCNDFIPKPIDKNLLISTIAQYIKD